MTDFLSLSNRCVFYSFCHWLSRKFLQGHLLFGLLGAFISRVFQLILVKLLVVFFFVFYNNKSRFSIRVFTVEPICTQRSVC